LQESNTQLKELIDRLADLKFQPGSVPLDNEDGNIMTELAGEIQQMLKEQDEDFELLQEQAYDLIAGKPGSETHERKTNLIESIRRGTLDLKSPVNGQTKSPGSSTPRARVITAIIFKPSGSGELLSYIFNPATSSTDFKSLARRQGGKCK
ncbi:hypothetical protein DH86_00000069, partial [Scytalidium sp. 3C]